jgi:hypothetical protein
MDSNARWISYAGEAKFKMTDDLVAEGKRRFYYVREGTAYNPIWDGDLS